MRQIELEPVSAKSVLARALASRCSAILLGCVLLAGFGCEKQSNEVQTPPVRSRVRRPVPPPALARTVQPTDPALSEEPVADDAAETRTAEARTELERGILYQNDRIPKGPWSVNLLKIDRSRAEFELATTLGRGRTLGLGPLSEQVNTLPPQAGRALAAINGDFYRTEHEPFEGDPRGLQIALGELVSAPSGKSAFWVTADGTPMLANVASQFKVTWPDGSTTPFGLNEERDENDAVLYTARTGPTTRARGGREFILVRSKDEPWLPLRAGQTYTAEVADVRANGNSRLSSDTLVLSIGPTLLARIPAVKRGAVLQISTATSPNLEGVRVAIGGGPILLHEGKVQATYTNKARERHPRTAFGWNDQYYFFVQVDGRQHGFSIGMTLPELAAYLARQGCLEAMNLDGGGSAEMWVEGQVVNRPCFGYERSTANGLVLVEKARVAAQ